jgi:basic amino acid/polyamine antiporter, APA family
MASLPQPIEPEPLESPPGLAETPPGGRGLFVRNATGLVRELTPFDALNLVLAAVLLPVGITQVMGFTPIFWPHANMFVSFLLATPLVTCFALVYLYFTVLMPRAGGDYVWVSRTLHPLAGFVSNFSLTFVYLTWVAFNFTFMLSVVGPGAAYVAGIHNHYFLSPTHGEMMIIATVLTAAFAGLMIVGVRAAARFMAVTFGIVWIGMIAWLVLMLFGSHAGFVSRWNGTSGATVTGITSQAQSLGFNVGTGIGWAATLFAMVYCFQVYVGFQWTGYVAGEIRDIKRTANTSIIGGLILSAITFIGGVGLIYKYYGFKFFGSTVYMGLGGGVSHWKLPFSPYLAALTKFLPGPHALAVFIAFCFVLSILWWTPAGFLAGSRNMFAWSFDRLAPERLTDVNDRFHTPVKAIVAVAVVIEFLNYLNIYQGLGAYLLNIIVVMGGAFIIVSVAAALTPWRRPSLHGEAPRWARAKLAGLPVITWVAAISGLSWVFVIYAAIHTGFGGTIGAKSMIEALTAPIIAVVWYAGVWLYRRNRAGGFSRVFQEIPPE